MTLSQGLSGSLNQDSHTAPQFQGSARSHWAKSSSGLTNLENSSLPRAIPSDFPHVDHWGAAPCTGSISVPCNSFWMPHWRKTEEVKRQHSDIFLVNLSRCCCGTELNRKTQASKHGRPSVRLEQRTIPCSLSQGRVQRWGQRD